MGGEERTFIDGHLSLHHVDVFERQFFYHFIFSISSLEIQRDIRNIIITQAEIDGQTVRVAGWRQWPVDGSKTLPQLPVIVHLNDLM